ncbi:hypothetical protein [Amycolatopsis sp. cmx-11-51]|uniref:hypothetical protein n=1 Tax=Amycolatopsis sp. cmx-11-51 TaxID=2785797 RepID=UPI0039E59AB3
MGRLGPIQRPAQEDGECSRYIWMPDGHEVGVSPGTWTSERPRRAPAPGNSLRGLNACDLLGPSETAAVLGSEGAKPEPDFGQWTYYWEHSPLRITVEFFRGRPHTDGPNGKQSKAGSRNAFVQPGKKEGDGDTGCEITIVHRAYRVPDPVNGERVELADVTVETKENIGSKRLCDLAIGLAYSMAGRLPPR